MFSKLYLLPKNILLLSEKITVFQELLLVSSLFSRRRKHVFFLLICNTTIFFCLQLVAFRLVHVKIFELSVDEHGRLQFQTFYTFRLHLSNKVSHIVCQLFRYSAHDAYLRLYNNADDESLQVTHFFVRKSHWIKWCSSEFIPLFINEPHIDDVAIFKNREYFCHSGVN